MNNQLRKATLDEYASELGDEYRDDYRIEKQRLSLMLRLVGGEVVEGSVFVQPVAYGAQPRETAVDLLNAHEPFFPIDRGEEDILLVAKDKLVEAWGEGIGEEDELRVTTARRVDADILLAGGVRITGTLLVQTPLDRPRLLDFLNDSRERFLRIDTPDGARLINTFLIESARPLD